MTHQLKKPEQKEKNFRIETTRILRYFLNKPTKKITRRKRMIAVTISDVTESVFKLNQHNTIIEIYTPGYWEDPKSFGKLKNIVAQ